MILESPYENVEFATKEFFDTAFNNACIRFQKYLKNYDVNDPKIHLKIVHTMGVVKASEYMAKKMKLGQEDTYLAKVIALLHDIGRFEQLRKFNSFDDSIIPHAQCSVDVLFYDGLILEFVPVRIWDDIIKTAIQYHGVYKMPTHLVGKERLHTCLIRDEDKIDNFRVKSEDSVTAMVDITAEELGTEVITEHIFNDFMCEKPILNSNRKTHMDMWVSYLGYLFDFNYGEAIAYLLEKDYIKQIIDRIPYTNPDTVEKMDLIRKKALEYAEKNASSIM